MEIRNLSTADLNVNERNKYDDLRSMFFDRFQEVPSFYARCPGRVNLIGEHIDYCGYSVLPMALEKDVIFAVSENKNGKIIFTNTDKKYREFESSLDHFIISNCNPAWYDYVLCGIKGVIDHFKAENVKSFNAMVTGCVPQNAGLSSSSALVCCSALALVYLNQWNISLLCLSELTAKCEHLIGTEGGGMDQAISLMANHGMAKLIEFNPLRTTDVHLPQSAVFVVCNSLTEHNKAATRNFNTRVTECRLAAQVIARSRGLQWQTLCRLRDVQLQCECDLDEMLAIVSDSLHDEAYSKDEICHLLDTSEGDLAETSLCCGTISVSSFKLKQRAHHVYSEAKRVLQFQNVCHTMPDDALYQLGALMNESHESCSTFYQCSHPDVDWLVQTCRDAGALGSRMTGAGWGGCTVSLVRSDTVDDFLVTVGDRLCTHFPEKVCSIIDAVFSTKPGIGAMIYTD